MLIAILSGYLVAVVALWLPRLAQRRTGWLLSVLPIALVLYFASNLGTVMAGETIMASMAWVPSLNINLTFMIDGLSLLFALLVSGIGALIVIYAGGYLGDHPQLGRFYAYLLVFMASMLGLTLAANVLTLFVFWELTSISSYLLIGFNHEEEKSRKSALQALLVTGGGGLALMAGLVLLGLVGGSFEFAALLTQTEAIQQHVLYLPILLLILAGTFTKSAQFPFHFWLPGAMAAPTPVSAYLHSATMVKAGIYLLLRLFPILGGTEAWYGVITVVGAVTMVVGAYLAWQQTDLKRILAYSTISSLGLLVLLIGIGTKLALETAVVFLVVHSLYKGALFMVAGTLDHETGTRDVTQLGGLYRVLPLTALAAGLASLSMAGIPPLIGFIGKELVYETLYDLVEHGGIVLLVLTVIANALLVAVGGLTAIRPFLGARKPTPHDPHGAPLSLWLGPLLLAVIGLVVGVFPALLADSLISPAATAALAEPVTVKLSLWHGITPMLILSAVTVLAGIAVYLLLPRLRSLLSPLDALYRWGPAQGYEWTLDGLNKLARWQTRVLQNGHLSIYLLVIIVTMVALAGYVLLTRVAITIPADSLDARFYEVGLAALILIATWLAINAQSRLAAIAALSVVGFSISLLYVVFSAPDLAMTQFTIETLTVVLFVLILYRLPRFANFTSKAVRLRDALVALSAGGLMTLFVLVATAQPNDSHLAAFFTASSLSLAKGQNIVNVILVDFRGIDTLGEITVLAVAAVGVFALLKLKRAPGKPTVIDRRATITTEQEATPSDGTI